MLGLVCLGLSACAFGCAADPGTTETVVETQQQGLQFEKFASDEVKGAYIDGANVLSFDSRWSKDAQSVTFDLNGKTVGSVDYNVANDGYFNANAAMNTSARVQMQKFVGAMQKLDEINVHAVFGDDTSKTSLGLLYNYADHMTTAPVNAPVTYRHLWGVSKINIPTTESWGGDGITYLWQCSRSSSNRHATAYWTDSRGYEQAYVACGISAPQCEGRCGAGCPCNSWYCVNRYYTQDCLEHDVCLDNNPSDGSTDPFAPNCGDEWGNAADDVLFGSSSGW